ncbi:MAG: circularly permuted type 2 ATP-grasp protein, partial [Leptospira sp.]|nr:circularly permuted type 2 ATP-grasp protein [Leptospira sp.]
VPDIIKYYLNEDPIIANVPTYLCSEGDNLKFVLDNIHNLVVKAANGAGGYGMIIGPKSTKKEQEEFKLLIKEDPRNYIAQPVLALSRVPTLVGEEEIEGRHVDLRPFILYSKDVYVMPGGLTRVALKKGSLVVNSSQGGGSKDTWVMG